MADDPNADKTFTLSEHTAILADRVSTETAAIVQERDGIKSERDELATKLDVETAARTAAETAKAEAEKALADFKAEVEEREAAAARKDDRLAKVKEAAPHLGADFLDEKNEQASARIVRIVAMADEAFEAYVTDLGATKPEGYQPPAPPRETAMVGDPAGGGGSTSAASTVLLGRFGGGRVQNGA